MDFSHAEKGAGLWAMELALAMEKLNFLKLRQLHAVASQHNDAQMTQFIGATVILVTQICIKLQLSSV